MCDTKLHNVTSKLNDWRSNINFHLVLLLRSGLVLYFPHKKIKFICAPDLLCMIAYIFNILINADEYANTQINKYRNVISFVLRFSVHEMNN